MPALGHDDVRTDAVPTISRAPAEQLSGIVDEIIIDDRVNHIASRYRELRLADGTSIALRGALTRLPR